MKKPSLGVCAISYNEEQDLPDFIEHLIPWVDEIVIIDDGSEDATQDIALRYSNRNVKFIHSPRKEKEYYSHQRNKAIRASTSDWLLHMDIDERVTPGLACEILEAIRNEKYDGYRYRRLNFFLHRAVKGGGWQKWNLVHLARRNKFKFGGKMHETCLLDAPDNRTGQLKNFMWHFNDVSFTERLRKSMVYSKIEGENICERGLKVKWYHFVVYPTWRAFKAYVIDLGFRDGTLGVIIACYTFSSVLNWYIYAWSMQNIVNRKDLEERVRVSYETSHFFAQLSE